MICRASSNVPLPEMYFKKIRYNHLSYLPKDFKIKLKPITTTTVSDTITTAANKRTNVTNSETTNNNNNNNTTASSITIEKTTTEKLQDENEQVEKMKRKIINKIIQLRNEKFQ